MTLTETEFQFLWSTASSLSVSGSSAATSDALTVAKIAWGQIEIKIDHSGTPGAADYVQFWLLPAIADPDGASTIEHATTVHGQFAGYIDANVEDPAILVVPITGPTVDFKLYALNNAGESVTVSAALLCTIWAN